MESMKKRLLTAAIALPLVVIILVLGEFFPWIMYALISFGSVIMVYELLSAKKLHKNLKIFIPCAFFAAAQPALIATSSGLLPVYLFVLLMFFLMIVFHKDLSYNDVSFALLGTVVITWGLTSVILIPNALGRYFSFFFVFGVGVPWIADAGAYFAGVFLGKHKLCPNISPKKTVEGFAGGIVAGIIGSVLIGLVYMPIYRSVSFNLWMLLIIGALVSIVSVLGDLSFSLIKRACNIKDYGSVFPGHGGFLDRCDSVILSAPIMYFMALHFEIFSVGVL